MKWKIFIFTASIVIIGAVTAIGILGFQKRGHDLCVNSFQSFYSSSSCEFVDIGTLFDPQFQQITYSSFAPIITESEAIATARNLLSNGFHIPTDNLQVEATVALFSGYLAPTDSHPKDRVVSNVPAWIVVIKNVPLGFPGSGPPEQGDNFTIVETETQYDVAIDATTGALLNAGLNGKIERVPIK